MKPSRSGSHSQVYLSPGLSQSGLLTAETGLMAGEVGRVLKIIYKL